MRDPLLSKRRILLVGVSGDLHEFAHVLYGWGYHVCWVTTLKEAVALRAQGCPAMVLADLREPSPIASPGLTELRKALKGENILVGLVDGGTGVNRVPAAIDHLLPEPRSASALTRFLEKLDSLWPPDTAGLDQGKVCTRLACVLPLGWNKPDNN